MNAAGSEKVAVAPNASARAGEQTLHEKLTSTERKAPHRQLFYKEMIYRRKAGNEEKEGKFNSKDGRPS